MPACYTHKKTGANVLRKLSPDTRKLIKQHLPYYLIGLHGPDILFYCPAAFGKEVSAYGRKLHHVPFSEFFENAKAVIAASEDDRQLVYLYGYLCHLFSDHEGHAILPDLYEEAGVTHGKMEAELDRNLMLADGYNPVNYPVAAHIAVNKEVAHLIAPFYLGVSENQVLESLIAMKASFSAARSRSSAYRKVASEVMAFAGFAEKIPSMIMTADRSELCLAVMPRLKEALDKAEGEIVDAIEELTKFIFFDEKMPNYIALRLDGHFEN